MIISHFINGFILQILETISVAGDDAVLKGLF